MQIGKELIHESFRYSARGSDEIDKRYRSRCGLNKPSHAFPNLQRNPTEKFTKNRSKNLFLCFDAEKKIFYKKNLMMVI